VRNARDFPVAGLQTRDSEHFIQKSLNILHKDSPFSERNQHRFT